MSSHDDQSSLSSAQLADLSALADGSLPSSRRRGVEEWVAGSPELSRLLERERAAVGAVRAVAIDQTAPSGLRHRLEAQRDRPGARRRALGTSGVLIGGLVAAAAVILALLILPAGTPGGPSVSQAAALWARGPVLGAPSPDPGDPGARLSPGNVDLYFPNWTRSLGWRATGSRVDTLGGRRVFTVYYDSAGRSVTYSIVDGAVLREPSARTRTLNGYVLRTLREGGRTVVTWRRDGHTCVLSAAGVGAADLQRLAGWRAA